MCMSFAAFIFLYRLKINYGTTKMYCCYYYYFDILTSASISSAFSMRWMPSSRNDWSHEMTVWVNQFWYPAMLTR